MQGAKVVSEDRTPSWWGDQVLTKRPLLTISKKDPPVLENPSRWRPLMPRLGV